MPPASQPVVSWNLFLDFQEVFRYEFMRNAFLAGTVVALMAGVLGYFVVLRRLAFASEALAHGGFAGATGAILVSADPLGGLVLFMTTLGAAMGLLGGRLRERDVTVGAVLTFSLALGSLFLSLSSKQAGLATNILFGNVLAISSRDVLFTVAFALATFAAIAIGYQPLLFASVDAAMAQAHGVPVRPLGIAFMMLLGVVSAASIQVVGVLLIYALLILPAATAQRLVSRPGWAIALAASLACVCVWVGLTLGYYVPFPPSFFIVASAFLIYVISRILLPAVGSTTYQSRRPETLKRPLTVGR